VQWELEHTRRRLLGLSTAMELETLSKLDLISHVHSADHSSWASLRRKHTGRDEPHNVKYWGLGNEGTSPLIVEDC